MQSSQEKKWRKTTNIGEREDKISLILSTDKMLQNHVSKKIDFQRLEFWTNSNLWKY